VAPAGTLVTALIGDTICGTTVVRSDGSEGDGLYVLDVASTSFQTDCGTEGATVTFTVGGVPAPQMKRWRQGNFNHLNLTAAGPELSAAEGLPAPAPSHS
jgi:hypothetical protein